MWKNKITIYPLLTHNGFWCFYWDKKEKAGLSKVRELTDEEIEKVRYGTRTEVSEILAKKYFMDPDTEEVFKVHFGISRMQDILKNNN